MNALNYWGGFARIARLKATKFHIWRITNRTVICCQHRIVQNKKCSDMTALIYLFDCSAFAKLMAFNIIAFTFVYVNAMLWTNCQLLNSNRNNTLMFLVLGSTLKLLWSYWLYDDQVHEHSLMKSRGRAELFSMFWCSVKYSNKCYKSLDVGISWRFTIGMSPSQIPWSYVVDCTLLVKKLHMHNSSRLLRVVTTSLIYKKSVTGKISHSVSQYCMQWSVTNVQFKSGWLVSDIAVRYLDRYNLGTIYSVKALLDGRRDITQHLLC